MPELPEVETTRRGILPYLEGHRIEQVRVHNGSLRWPVSSQLYDLREVPVRRVLRRGKYIIVELPEGAMLLHLGMSGSLRLVQPDTLLKKHDHVEFDLSSGMVLRLNDPRRFGCALWAEHWPEHELVKNLGLEPLEADFDADYLFERAKGRKTSIKQFIMNGNLVVGVGNIYANESLFLSGISPKRAAGRISKARMGTLVGNIKLVLKRSIEQGGTTLRDFVNSDGSPGYFKQQLFVYGRAGETCKHCASTLKEIRQNNRATVYCPKCQS